ncbi:hypothetical protein X971_1964 [Agrobacterium tumefaciens LBA4213 (Ach5)]|nr:hypothetical protein X971_1964 [Agrobacterium tumefaciens LBA4213 (Ach5)]
MFPIKHGYVSSCVVFMRASLQKCRYVSNTDLSVFRIISASLHVTRIWARLWRTKPNTPLRKASQSSVCD